MVGPPVTLDPEIRKYLPPLTPDELAGLEESILAEGIREPLVVWHERGVLLDGHNRLSLAQKHDLPYRTREISFADATEVRQWVIRNQLGRRNLKPDAASYLRGLLKNEADITAGQRKSTSDKLSEVGPAEALAQELGVDQRTLRRDAKFADAVDALADVGGEEVRDLVMSGKVPKQDTIRLANTAKESPEQAKAALDKIKSGDAKNANQATLALVREKREKAAKAQPDKPTVTLADWREWLPQQPDCDLLLTDPPYMTDVDDIAAFAAEWLPAALAKVKPTGRAYVCIGAYPDELRAYLSAATIPTMHLANILVWTYRNTLGPSPALDYKQNWQAILYFRGPDAPPLDCPVMTEQFSVQDINAPDGRLGDRYHTWQKPDELAERLIRHATQPGDLVLDPFAGTGTFILAAARLGRAGNGCDASEDMLAIALRRGCAHGDRRGLAA